MAKVNKTDSCWLFTATLTAAGYGWIGGGKAHRHQPVFAHRVAYSNFVGPIPDGMNVLHRCDVPNCVRPDHLFLGTQLDNVIDMTQKGRRVDRPRAFSHEEALARFRSGESITHIAKSFGVHWHPVRNAIRAAESRSDKSSR